MIELCEWQLWMHPYPTMVKYHGRRISPTRYPWSKVIQDDKEFVNITDFFEARKQTPPQLKRCVRAIVKKEVGDVSDADKGLVRAAISKGFAICTANLQKHGYMQKGSHETTKSGDTSGRSKAAQDGHKDKVAEYEKILARARKDSAA